MPAHLVTDMQYLLVLSETPVRLMLRTREKERVYILLSDL